MKNLLRMASLGATVAALTLTATPAAAYGLVNANPNATAHVKILQGLVLKSTQNLDLGTVVLGPGTWTATVSVDRNNVFSCDGGSGNVVCSGAPQRAIYNVQGSNNAIVKIASSPVTLSNGTSTLTLTPDHAATVTLTNSGAPGNNFGVGGSVTISNTTPDGDYTGTFALTAEYQ